MNREEREQELLQWAKTDAGRKRIINLWKKIKGIPEGEDTLDTTISSHVRFDMIPDILNNEFLAT